MELQYNFPSFRIGPTQYQLRTLLLKSLENLSEISVLNILEAYQKLPPYFPVDLLDEIKEMVIVTLTNSSGNLKTNFLLDFVNQAT